MTHSLFTMSLLGVQAFCAMLGVGCQEPEEIVKKHVEERGDGEYHVTTIEEDVAGWTLVRATNTEVSHPTPRCKAVRSDGTLVTEDESAELLKIYEALGVFEDDEPSAEVRHQMVAASDALVGGCQTPVYANRVSRVDGWFDDVDVEAPEVQRKDGDVILVYWAHAGDRRVVINRHKVVAGEGEVLETKSETMGIQR